MVDFCKLTTSVLFICVYSDPQCVTQRVSVMQIHDVWRTILLGYTVHGKILAGENFGEFGERLAIRQNFPHQYL